MSIGSAGPARVAMLSVMDIVEQAEEAVLAEGQEEERRPSRTKSAHGLTCTQVDDTD